MGAAILDHGESYVGQLLRQGVWELSIGVLEGAVHDHNNDNNNDNDSMVTEISCSTRNCGECGLKMLANQIHLSCSRITATTRAPLGPAAFWSRMPQNFSPKMFFNFFFFTFGYFLLFFLACLDVVSPLWVKAQHNTTKFGCPTPLCRRIFFKSSLHLFLHPLLLRQLFGRILLVFVDDGFWLAVLAHRVYVQRRHLQNRMNTWSREKKKKNLSTSLLLTRGTIALDCN